MKFSVRGVQEDEKECEVWLHSVAGDVFLDCGGRNIDYGMRLGILSCGRLTLYELNRNAAKRLGLSLDEDGYLKVVRAGVDT